MATTKALAIKSLSLSLDFRSWLNVNCCAANQIMSLMVLLYPLGAFFNILWMPDVAHIMQISNAKHGGKNTMYICN